MIRTQSYIHGWQFTPKDAYVLADLAKLTAKGSLVRLRAQRRLAPLPGRGLLFFPADDDLFVRTTPFSPGARVSWDFIEVRGDTPKDLDLGEPTSFAVRIHDGTDSRFWGGASWDIAGAGDWNTEADLNTNLSAYTGTSLAVEVRLMTTDEALTPTLVCVLLRWTGVPVNVIKNFLYEGIVAQLEDDLRPLGDWVEPGNGTTSMTFGPELGDTKYQLTDVLAVYNHTTDPGHTTDLLTGFAANVATLSAPIPITEKAWVVFEYKPTIAVTTSSDFVIGARVPAIWITDISPGERKQLGAVGPEIIDRTLVVPAGTVFPNPIPFRDVAFAYAIIAPLSRDLLALGEAMDGWTTAHPTIRAPLLDLRTSLRPGIVPTWDTTTTDEDDTRLATGTFILKNVPVFGDSKASAANSSGASEVGRARIGPVDAGDPDFPGVGYGVARVSLTLRTDKGGVVTITVTD